MNKPEQEMLLVVLEKKTSQSGNEYYVGFMGLNSVYASEFHGKLFVKLQKWPKKEKPVESPASEDDVSF